MSLPFPLKSTLDRAASADPEDTLKTKKALNRLGHYEPPDYGFTDFPDEKMFKGIESFQAKHKLRKDGVMRPGGETAKKIGSLLGSAKPDEAKPKPRPTRPHQPLNFLDITEGVGEGRMNRPEDVWTTKNALSLAGFTQQNRSGTEHTERLTDTVKRFQTAQGLKPDGWLKPFGETETSLNAAIAPKLEEDRKKAKGAPTGQDNETQTAAIPFIVYKLAEILVISVAAALMLWQSSSPAQKKILRALAFGGGSDDGDASSPDKDLEEFCRYLNEEVDIPRCRAQTRRHGKQAGARCYKSAADRYEACKRGIPENRLPPLDVWNN